MSRTVGFVLLSFAFLVTMFGTTLPTPLYPLFQERYSFGELTTTVVFAVYAFGVIAGLLLFGALSDEIGRKPVLAAGLALSAGSALLFVFAGSLVPIYAGRILSGLSAGIFTERRRPPSSTSSQETAGGSPVWSRSSSTSAASAWGR